MSTHKKRFTVLLGGVVFTLSACFLAGCETFKSVETSEKISNRVEDEKMIEKDIDNEGSYRLTDVEQHRYFMKEIDSIVDYAQESREQGASREEVQQQLDKVEQEIVFLDKLQLPNEIKVEYLAWKKEKQEQLDALKKKLPDKTGVNLDAHKYS